ncbi:MAG: CBS domain-containing protein [Nitrospira sp.]|nr:CBS domain-containing protein [Nitrospira sp.]
MKPVRELLRIKGQETWSVTPDTPVYDALKLMAEKNVGALLVLDGDKLAGILSERDYARKVILKGKASKNTPAREIMSENVVCVTPEQSVAECMALMTDKHIRHLPVIEDGKLVGVISIGDVVKAIISEQKFVIEQLEHYIAGTR